MVTLSETPQEPVLKQINLKQVGRKGDSFKKWNGSHGIEKHGEVNNSYDEKLLNYDLKTL